MQLKVEKKTVRFSLVIAKAAGLLQSTRKQDDCHCSLCCRMDCHVARPENDGIFPALRCAQVRPTHCSKHGMRA
jgi:hypothetical protein